MKRFLSLPKKVVLLLLVLLLALSAAMSTLWLQKTNEDFLLAQKEIRQQNQGQFLLLNQMFRNRIESWVELLVQLHQNEPNQISALAKTLESKYDFLQFNLQVEGLWLFESDGTLAFKSQDDTPPHILSDVKKAFDQQSSIKSTYCDNTCTEVMSIPILENNGSMSVFSLSIGLIDTLAFLNQSTQATLAVVHSPARAEIYKAKNLYIRGPLAKRQHEFVSHLIESFPDDLTLNTLLLEGTQLDVDQQTYFVALIPMTTANSDSDYVLSAHDITPIILAHRSYQKRIIITAAAVFVGALLLFYIMTNSIRKRLVLLASRLPLLAQRDYSQFAQQNQVAKHYFRDELDTLNDSAQELADRLALLDQEVLTKTSELERMAMYDHLTQLPNRNMLLLRLKQAVAKLQRRKGLVVLLLFDLDDFKKVNDSHGHSVGDDLLSEAAVRFQSVVRTSDLACRLGGDEFAIMLEDIDSIDGAIKVADKLLERFRSPINVGRLRFYVSTSIGLAFTESSETDVAELIRCSDIAMYQAKSLGGNSYQIFDESMSQRAIDKVALEDEARGALVNDNFSFALQPQIELDTGKLVGFEALLRWEHPERGFVSPGYFIPILESTEFMLTLGYWCIESAFKLLKKFNTYGYPNLKIAINLAGIQFLDPDLIPYLEEKIKDTKLKPELLELELTERTLVSDVEKTTAIMQQLIDKGFIISIDDFGTGYSSLSYLKRMPAHYIKIDQAFIDGMVNNDADKQIVNSTVAMVQNLNMQVIAEGIEQQIQVDMLKDIGCDMAQGYFIARPIPEAILFDELEKYCSDGIWQYPKPGN
ncbi:putative bifunctional diguanylate cyclase/phosphodiesterase [Aliiglaciecola litoralis]|uniref:Diguanylate cyclase (GGDEF) domain-containing protein n=1 Tax=Aliiglaciecola litoralis TaxID=582857 RepID=A0ABP3WSM1_9ALTE